MCAKCLYKIVMFITLLYRIQAYNNNECNKIVIEGGEQALRKLFSDFNEMKTVVQELKFQCEENQEKKTTEAKNLPMFDIRIDTLPKKCEQDSLPRDCAEAVACTQRSGIYKIKVSNEAPFYVECDAQTDDGDWLVIQRRQDGSVNFYRGWDEYETGFGDLEGEFFIGLRKLYLITNSGGAQELMVIMEDANHTTAFAKYNSFAIADASDMYKLRRLGRYTGTAGDSLQQSVGFKFTTKDRDNDNYAENCAVLYRGAWWHNACHWSNLNGEYGNNEFGKGVNWKTFSTYNSSLKYAKMMIRRRRF